MPAARQWALDTQHLNGPRLWERSKGDGVTVAVVDSGVDAGHPDLGTRVLPGADFTGHAADGRLDVSPDSHGTAVAGIIAGTGRNRAGAAVTGLAPEADILPIRVADGAVSDLTAVAQGIDYATTHGARVINISLCTPIIHPQIRDAVAEAIRQDIVVVAAAGNDGLDGNSPQYPAALPGVLAVAASDVNGHRWAKSETGSYIGLTAPGVDIYTTGRQGSYVTVTGTSFAAPHVAAAAALLRSRYRNESATQIITRLTSTADHAADRTGEVGYGIMDAGRALTTEVPSPDTANPLFEAPQAAAAVQPREPHRGRTGPLLLVVYGSVGLAALAGAGMALRRWRRPRQPIIDRRSARSGPEPSRRSSQGGSRRPPPR